MGVLYSAVSRKQHRLQERL